jgi:hypothetical protein
MRIVVVCFHCRYHDSDPNIEINFREGVIYYLCPECKKESKIKLKADILSLPKSKRL